MAGFPEHFDKNELALLACQIAIPETTNPKQRDRHLQRSAALIQDELQQQRAHLVVLPELSSIDYARSSFAQLDSLAEPDEGPSFLCWSAIAKANACTIVYGFPRRTHTGFRISSAVVSASGDLLGVYDKLHLAQFGDSMEKEYFNESGEQLLVFKVNDFRIGLIICYDIRFPELCRELVLKHQVDIILHVGAYARDATFHSWHTFVETRAIENQCFLLSLNRAGEQYGESLLCPPWLDNKHGPTRFHKSAEECRLLLIDKGLLAKTRSAFSFLNDRLHQYDLPRAEITRTEKE